MAPPQAAVFFTGDSRTFFTASGRFLNRGGCCRHAAHDGGDGDDGKEENSFSDGHWLQPHQGEADSIRHGFLCLPQPLAASTNGGRQPRQYPQPPRSTLLYYIVCTSLPTQGHEKASKRAGAVTSISSCFFTGDSRIFFTAAGRFLNRGGCCRHAAHDGGEGDNGKEENLFSDRHWLQPH